LDKIFSDLQPLDKDISLRRVCWILSLWKLQDTQITSFHNQITQTTVIWTKNYSESENG